MAQQLRSLKTAKDSRALRFLFEGREVPLVPSCGCFATMNPTYAGRVELPDNLKSLLRPVTMTRPDSILIAEVLLYSEGVEEPRLIAMRFAAVYRLAAEQLSQQKHYDFGLRAMRAALILAGKLKRSVADKEDSDEAIVVRAISSLIMPILIMEDVSPFLSLLTDVFGDLARKCLEKDYRSWLLRDALLAVIAEQSLQLHQRQVDKVLQLYGAMQARHGIMLIGQSGVGKTTITTILSHALTQVSRTEDSKRQQQLAILGSFLPVAVTRLNPKAITLEELFGKFDVQSFAWTDGLLPHIIRNRLATATKTAQWIVCDGPVDSSWTENLNSMLDESRVLCLANGERIQFPHTMHIVCEVDNLESASPAITSRCGMVFVEQECLTWQVLTGSWIRHNIVHEKLSCLTETQVHDMRIYLTQLFDSFVPAGWKYLREKSHSSEHYPIPVLPLASVHSLCRLLHALFQSDLNYLGRVEGPSTAVKLLCGRLFLFSFIWSFGGAILDPKARKSFDTFVRETMVTSASLGLTLPLTEDCFSFYVEPGSSSFQPWDTAMRKVTLSPQPSASFVMPTPHTTCYHFLASHLLRIGHATLVGGSTGAGKSVIIQEMTNSLIGPNPQESKWSASSIQLTAFTQTDRMQKFLETRLLQRRQDPESIRENLLAIVEDLSIPLCDENGNQVRTSPFEGMNGLIVHYLLKKFFGYFLNLFLFY